MQRRQFVTRCINGTTAIATVLVATPTAVAGKLTSQPTPDAEQPLQQRYETPLAIYEKRASGDWITLKPGTTMAAMAQEVRQLNLPFQVLATENGEFVLQQTKVTNGPTTLNNRAFSPARQLT